MALACLPSQADESPLAGLLRFLNLKPKLSDAHSTIWPIHDD
jgi:hypothetical protein